MMPEMSAVSVCFTSNVPVMVRACAGGVVRDYLEHPRQAVELLVVVGADVLGYKICKKQARWLSLSDTGIRVAPRPNSHRADYSGPCRPILTAAGGDESPSAQIVFDSTFVPRVCLLVPRAVVEVFVLVGGLVTVQPVDANALVAGRVGSVGVVPGVLGAGAAEDPEGVAVVLDVGVARGSPVLDEGVVVADVRGPDAALRGGQEQQPELVSLATRPLGFRLQSAGTTVGGPCPTRNTADRP